MTVGCYNSISNNVRDAAKLVAETSMNNAVNEFKKGSANILDMGVTVDGTWQRRGYSSMNGVVVAISVVNGKITDMEPLSRYCRQWFVQGNALQNNKEQLAVWKKSHEKECKLNIIGNPSAMEPERAIRIFGRSIEKRGVRYMKFYGDGDNKAFSTVQHRCGEEKVEKQECIWHYLKRVGCRLRKLKKMEKGLKDITERAIGKAIRASFFHLTSSDTNNFHNHCPKPSTSWCQFRRNIVNKTNMWKSGKGLSSNFIKFVKPIYQELTKPGELQKCLHGLT